MNKRGASASKEGGTAGFGSSLHSSAKNDEKDHPMTDDPTMDTPGYLAVPAQVDFPALEHEILSLWGERDTFTRSLERTAGGEPLNGTCTASMPAIDFSSSALRCDELPLPTDA